MNNNYTKKYLSIFDINSDEDLKKAVDDFFCIVFSKSEKGFKINMELISYKIYEVFKPKTEIEKEVLAILTSSFIKSFDDFINANAEKIEIKEVEEKNEQNL